MITAPLRKLQVHKPTAAEGGGQIVRRIGGKNELAVSEEQKKIFILLIAKVGGVPVFSI